MRRKKREGEVVCRCRAYPFPHRMLGGACTGKGFVLTFFERNLWSECRGCHFLDTEDPCETRCQVVDGLEPPMECPGLQELVDYEDMPLYGKNSPRKNRGVKRCHPEGARLLHRFRPS